MAASSESGSFDSSRLFTFWRTNPKRNSFSSRVVKIRVCDSATLAASLSSIARSLFWPPRAGVGKTDSRRLSKRFRLARRNPLSFDVKL